MMAPADPCSVVVNDNAAESRYELVGDGVLLGVEEYELRGDRLALVHTGIFPEFAGGGLAKVLVEGVLADARRRGLSVLPVCPYVRKVIAEQPGEYLGLVAERDRATFDLPS